MTALADSFLPEGESVVDSFSHQVRNLQNAQIEVLNFQSKRQTPAKSDVALLKETFKEIERFRSRDRMVPSYHNIITSTSLHCFFKWMVHNFMPVDLSLFLSYTRYGTFGDLRRFAADAVILLNGLRNPEVLAYYLNMMTGDPDPHFRYHLCSSLSRAVSLKMLNQDANKQHDYRNIWSFIDPAYLATEDVAKQLWSLLIAPTTEKRVCSEVLTLIENLYHLPSELAFQPAPKLKIKMAIPTIVVKESKVEEVTAITYEIPDELPVEPVPEVEVVEPGPPVILNYEELNKTGMYIINKLKEHPSGGPFLFPVDELEVPRYRQIIKHPMDLQTMTENLKAGVYGERLAGLFVDIRQMFKNCSQFNLEESAIYQHGKRLEHYFEKDLLPEAVPEMAAVVQGPAIAEPKPPVIPLKIPKLSMFIKKKDGTPYVPPPPPVVFTYQDSQACRRMLSKLFTHPGGIWFQSPVSLIV